MEERLSFDVPGDRSPKPEFLTIAEAAQRVRCCDRTIRRAIESGALRAGRIHAVDGRRGGLRIRPGDLETWMYGMTRKRREPTIEVREHACADGSVTEMWSVRYYDATGARRRLRCASREEADFERARLVLAEARGGPVAASVVAADDGSGLTLAGFWPMYRADAESRLARSTLREYQRIWDRRLGPRFGRLRLDAIGPAWSPSGERSCSRTAWPPRRCATPWSCCRPCSRWRSSGARRRPTR